MSTTDYLSHLFSYEGQVVVVIGGTGVLGGALCDGFGKAGGHVIVSGRSEERGQERVQAIQQAGGSAEFIAVDVFERASIESLRDQVLAAHGQVDVVVNCAGMNAAVAYEEISDDDWDWIMAGNLRSTQVGCQLFAAHMKTQDNGGSILNIGSVTSHLPLSKVFAYSASKAAVVNLTKNVAREYATQGVRVNAICPGFFPAEQNRKILAPERVEKIMGQTPMDRFGEPEELIGAALLLCSRNAGSFITGADYYVDGGFTANRF
ncbi:MAG: gluconate 5-dehydrogenase [Planctomycetaceae bacterium]|nr:gluconate 5-dehydrogenase [Planctomycetaceae bacterium]|tara:strand:- start:5073 stop:5861 length:789 start_codon:yes stop_codon:yes gene_type:complete